MTKCSCYRKRRFPERPLPAGALVDPIDWPLVNQFSWNISGPGYLYRGFKLNGVKTGFSMHRFLMGKIPPNMVVDHINGNKLDNRRSNLRVVSVAENSQNQRKSRNPRSGFRGVIWSGKTPGMIRTPWVARATISYKRHHLGYFSDPKEANRVIVQFRALHMPGAIEDGYGNQ